VSAEPAVELEPAKVGVRIAAHPRASAQVRRAKGAGGLVAFAIAAWATYRAGGDAAAVLAWGLCAGVAGALVAWAAAVTAWRALMIAEMREARARAIARAQERRAEAAERAAAEAAAIERMARDEDGEETAPRARRRR
jgi:hypothetical protein